MGKRELAQILFDLDERLESDCPAIRLSMLAVGLGADLPSDQIHEMVSFMTAKFPDWPPSDHRVRNPHCVYFTGDPAMWISCEVSEGQPVYKGTQVSMMGKVHTNILSFEENQWKYKLKGQWVAFAKTDAWSLYDVLGCDVWRRPTGKKKKYPGQLWSRFEREAISEEVRETVPEMDKTRMSRSLTLHFRLKLPSQLQF